MTPAMALQAKLEEKGWTQSELASIIGTNAQVVNDILRGKRKTTGRTATLLGQAFGVSEDYWSQLQIAYDVTAKRAEAPKSHDTQRKAAIHSKFPVRDMVKRGWIEKTNDLDYLESQIAEFTKYRFNYAPRQTDNTGKEPLRLAWIYKAYQLSRKIQVERFTEFGLSKALKVLREFLADPEDIHAIPEVLRLAGVRFVVVQGLAGSEIDGACFWLDEQNPVVAISLRRDQIDRFWFVLMHEIHHVKFGDGKNAVVMDEAILESPDRSQEEELVNAEAANYLIPNAEMEKFIARVYPVFNPMQVLGFARRMNVHPGIVVGQLQHLGHLRWNQQTKSLVKVRGLVTATATYDGWGMAV
jgi:HTH-type transcriptional regulator/antitoxin HigA